MFDTVHPARPVLPLALALLLTLAACGGGGGAGEDGAAAPRFEGLAQAAYVAGSARYEYGHGSALGEIAISGAPADADGSRWAMLHDGSRYRLYCMRLGDDATLYQFGYDGATQSYVFGYDSIAQLGITGTPPGADTSRIAMLHDGADYRLYMRDRADPWRLHQFAFNPASGSYEYGFRSIAAIQTSGVPADADPDRWAMLHDGTTYRQYVAQAGSATTVYQFGFDGRTYAYGHDSIARLSIDGMPSDSDASTFAMLHDGGRYRLYRLTR